MSGKEETCITCEWYVMSISSCGIGGKVCVNKRSNKFMPNLDDSCKYWQERKAQADSGFKKILDAL